jgi:hypothetical protein
VIVLVRTAHAGLRSTYGFNELADFVGKLIGLPRERVRGFKHLAGDMSGPIRCLLDADDGLRDFMRAACHELSVSGDFMGHCGLLLYRRGDFNGDRLHLSNGMDDSAKVADCHRSPDYRRACQAGQPGQPASRIRSTRP